MNTVISTAEFWALMCRAATIRTSRLSLVNRGRVYVTLEAPEDVPGLIDGAIGCVRSSLGCK